MTESSPVEKPIGAVLVIGGGVGGIQASLDLAESGFKVYMVDSSPSIGGIMARLDKTFPTNDCAMCILSPAYDQYSTYWFFNGTRFSQVSSIPHLFVHWLHSNNPRNR